MLDIMSLLIIPFLVIALLIVLGGLRIANQYERAVVFRLGRYQDTRGPGLYWIIPFVVWYRIVNPKQAKLEVKNIDNAVIQVALTALRTGIGQHSLDEVLKEQEAVSLLIQQKIDAVTEPWGVKVERVEMKNVEIPISMQRAMAQEAEALREKRARLIKAQAEFEAAAQLRQAAEIIMQNPAGLELRRMQMITEVGAEQNTMTIVMMPSEFVSAAGALSKLVPA